MRAEAPRLSDWLILVSSFAGAAVLALVTLEFIAQIISGHGSPAGNAIRIAAALMSLLTGIFCLIFGTLYWKSFYRTADKSIAQ